MLKNEKFILTDESKTMNDGSEVFRIKAIANFHDVVAGDLGGFVEKEENLSFVKKDTSWIYDDAAVYGDSKIMNNSYVYNSADIKDSTLNASTLRYSSRVHNSSFENTQS